MTRDEAIAVAAARALEEGWPWIEPIEVRSSRKYFVVGKREWHILSNRTARGGNVRIVIEDSSGLITYAGLSPM